MSWRDQYQPGSFRGVPFVTQRHELQGGRRVEVHEFPGRDDPLPEDLGRRARQFSIECFVWGPDYYADRDALLDALEASGPATLVHPWHGSKRVSVLDFSLVETTEDGGLANFQIMFVEAPAETSAAAAPDTSALATGGAADVLDAAPADFAGRFDVSNVPAFVDDAALDLVNGLSEAALISAGMGGGAGSVLRAFDAGLRLLGVDGLIHAPLALGNAIAGLVSAVGAMAGTPRGRLAALHNIAIFGDALPPVIGATPARHQQRENQAALVHLVRASASAEMVRTVADIRFSSYEEAVGTRDSLADLLDRWGIAAADAGEDGRAATFDHLRLVMVRDITARGGTLARLYGYRLQATEPALVIANRLYGAGRDFPAHVADLVARNAVRHPGFVPGGSEIRVVTNG